MNILTLRERERKGGEKVPSHSTILAWKTPWTEEPGGLQSMESQKSRTQLSAHARTHA